MEVPWPVTARQRQVTHHHASSLSDVPVMSQQMNHRPQLVPPSQLSPNSSLPLSLSVNMSPHKHLQELRPCEQPSLTLCFISEWVSWWRLAGRN
ncbi:Hypothetical predicted protein [Xyrichtys novacula]|uniref:Uncharacterized protein n=1 Tax=Xyrichtys novacula TaxID=13765 RepID=A0AAV1F8M2_XYRNO|nr:Hypothetical predicted protein [Xyrichtys novacula]